MDIVSPEQAGFSGERLERVNTVMRAYAERRTLPGMITVITRKGKLVHFECHGLMNAEAGKPMGPDTIFRIYSMTKPVTAAAVMMLLEEGHLLLGDPVSKHIPEFKKLKVLVNKPSSGLELEDVKCEITIKDLLAYTSGLSYGFFGDNPVEDLFREANLLDPLLKLLVPLGDLVQRLIEIPLASQPGTEWRYSIAFDVLGHLVSLLTDMPFEVFLEDRIFDPLGMVDTGFFVPEGERERLAALYGVTEAGEISLLDSPASSPFLDPDVIPSGGAGLVSTAQDYLRFVEMLQRGGELGGSRLLGRKTLELMTRNHLPASMLPMRAGSYLVPELGTGLGFGVILSSAEKSSLASEGTFIGGGAAGTDFWVDPQEELIGMFMPQIMGLPEPVNEVFRNLVYQALID